MQTILEKKSQSTSLDLITDTHAHLGDAAFDADRSEVLNRARQVGVGSIVTVGENLEDARQNLALAETHPGLKPAAGLYPTILDPDQAEAVAQLIREHRDHFVAIGEVGLDYWAVTDPTDQALQRDLFTLFCRLSIQTGLPMSVHSRSAGRHAVDLLIKNNVSKAILHAFDGKASSAMPAVEAGYYFSIPPSIVRSRQKQKLVARLPLDVLMIESDSPVLGPVPGVRNEPVNSVIAGMAIAHIKSMPVTEVFKRLQDNTIRLLGERIVSKR